MSRFLTIFEVSQKQNFIFSSNALRTNIKNSDIIAYITDCAFITEVIGDDDLFNKEHNLVYSGGGHTILQFDSLQGAQAVTEKVTYRILKNYPKIEFFAKTIEYDNTKTPGENIKVLISELEKKKALRSASFHQLSFGVEKIDSNTKRPIEEDMIAPDRDERVPEGFRPIYAFADFTKSDKESGFIAIVHIDGNAMGKRVERLSSSKELEDWSTFCSSMCSFSESVAEDFTAAYEKMQDTIAENINNGNLSELNLKEKDGKKFFPVRRIISEGDDICFVSEGHIGIECARIFINELTKIKNKTDQKYYSACAGVAIVHQKYPFYRAYELAEQLCSSAKKLGASLSSNDRGSEVSSIDWHIEYGELQDSLEETRKQYETEDGKLLNLRPYIIAGPKDIINNAEIRKYEFFKNNMNSILEGNYSDSLLKNLREALKKGADATEYYLRFHKAESVASDFYRRVVKNARTDELKAEPKGTLSKKIFIETEDKKFRSIMFDVIEAMDTFLSVKEV